MLCWGWGREQTLSLPWWGVGGCLWAFLGLKLLPQPQASLPSKVKWGRILFHLPGGGGQGNYLKQKRKWTGALCKQGSSPFLPLTPGLPHCCMLPPASPLSARSSSHSGPQFPLWARAVEKAAVSCSSSREPLCFHPRQLFSATIFLPRGSGGSAPLHHLLCHHRCHPALGPSPSLLPWGLENLSLPTRL